MSWLLIIGLKNAILVGPLALLALAIGRYSKRPALAHVLWLIVLVKLLTPPLVDVPVGWQIDVESLIASSEEPPAAEQSSLQTASQQLAPSSQQLAASPPIASLPPVEHSQVTHTTAERRSANSRATVALAPAAAPTIFDRAAALAPRSAAVWTGLVAAAWLVGSAIVVTLLARRAWHFHRFLRLAARVDDRLGLRVKTLARAVGLGSCPRVVVVEGVVSPMLWGVGGRTRLIFPAKLAERLDDSEIDSLLLHELAHYARGDHWVRLLELAAHVLYWWHPVVWWARREIEAAEEQCCDAWVVQHQHGSRRSYAEALLTTIDFLCEPQCPVQPALPPAACGLGDVPLLRSRLKQIMQGQLATGLSRGVQVALLVAGIAISPLQPALWATSSLSKPSSKGLLPRPSAPSALPPAAVVSDVASNVGSGEATQSASTAPATTITTEPVSLDVSSPFRASPLRWSALSPDGRYRLEVRRDGVTLVRERTTWRLDLSSYDIQCASFALDGRSFVTGHEDGTLRWWDCETGGHLNTFGDKSGAITSVAFGPDNQVAAGTNNGAVTVIDLVSGAETRLSGLPSVACVRWSPDGSHLGIGLGDYKDEQGAVLNWDPYSSDQPEQYVLPRPVGALGWLNDTSLIIADWAGQSQIFDTTTAEIASSLKLEKTLVSAAAWSPDCRLVTHWQAQELAPGAAE